jgi:hypothetical protein
MRDDIEERPAEEETTRKKNIRGALGFHYSALPADLVCSLQKQAAQIRERVKNSTIAIIEMSLDGCSPSSPAIGTADKWFS